MLKLLRSIFVVLTVVVALFSVYAPIRAQEPENEPGVVHRLLDQNQAGKIHSLGYVKIQNMSYKDLFNFVSDLRNDHLWYPGVISSVRTSGNGGAGSTFVEVLNLGAGEVTINAWMLEYRPHTYYKITSDGFLSNVTEFFVVPGRHGSAILVINSFVDQAPGVTQEMMQGYMTLTFQNLLARLGKTGSFRILR